MRDVAVLLRAMQLYTHNCHNLMTGVSFFADHEYLGTLYPIYEVAYDSVIERVIGLGFDPDLASTTLKAATMVAQSSATEQHCFSVLLSLEKELCTKCEEYIQSVALSEGTKQLLGDICDKSEARQYQLRQRIR